MEIYIVRHALKIGDSLSIIGKVQAKTLGLYFKRKEINPDFLYSSPRNRCIETAKIMKKYAGWDINITIREDLRGIEGPKGEEESYEALLTKVAQKSGKSFLAVKVKDGESFLDLEKRVQNFINFLKENHKNDIVVIISHKNFIRTFIVRMLNLPLPFILRTEVPYASITYFRLNKDFEIEDYFISYSQHLVDVFEEPIPREKICASNVVFSAAKKDNKQEIKWIKDLKFKKCYEKDDWIIFRKVLLD